MVNISLNKKVELEKLNKSYEKMQKKYGAKELDSICNGGCIDNPDICFVFMNPTGKNIASLKSWKGIKAPWLGTKNIWKLFNKVGLFSDDIYTEIMSKITARKREKVHIFLKLGRGLF